MVTQKVRRVGHSLVITIPKEEAERLAIHEGDVVGVELRKVEVGPVMAPDVQAAFEQSWHTYQADYRYLAEH